MFEPRRKKSAAQSDGAALSPSEAARVGVPQSLEAEQSCLGAMLMQGEPSLQRDIVSTVMCVLAPEHFYREHHRDIYRAVIDLYTAQSPVDYVTVPEELRRRGLLESCGGVEYLMSLIGACPSSGSVENYARIVRGKADDRARLHVLESAILSAKGEKGSAKATFEAMRELEEIERQSQMARLGAKAAGVVSASELLEQKLPDARMTVEGLLPVGLTILAGNPKIGKSWMSLTIGIGVATGEEVLGRAAQAGEALYLALEDTPKRLQDRLRHLWKGAASALSRLHLVTEWPRLDDGGAEKLDAWLSAHPACKLVVIDTLQKFRPAVRGAAGDFYGEDYAAVGELKRVADARGVSILLVHHTRKSSGMSSGGDALEEVAGTMGITGAADGILVLRRVRGGGEATLFVTGRDVDEQELAVKWDSASGVWSLLGDAGEVQMSGARKIIWQTLWEFHQSGQACATPSDIAGALGRGDTNAIRQNLHQMVNDGQIRRLDRGEYALLEDDKQRAKETPIAPRETENNANNANKWGGGGFIKPRDETDVSDVSALGEDEPPSLDEKFLAGMVSTTGISPGQARQVADDFHTRSPDINLNTFTFRSHLAQMRNAGQLREDADDDLGNDTG